MAAVNMAEVAFLMAKERYTTKKNSLICYLNLISQVVEELGVVALMDYRGRVEQAWEQFASANNKVDEASPFLMSRTWDYDEFHALRIRKADLMDVWSRP